MPVNYDYCIAIQGIYCDSKYISRYWMKTTRGNVKYHWKKMGVEICVHIYLLTNSSPKNREKEVWNPTKYLASKARKRDVAKTTK